jgi:osmoprotectant transport system ATP-binding protein
VIELQQVSKTFRAPAGEAVRAVDDLTLTIHDGEALCLIGPSGCGKTTTLKLINRLLEPTSGAVLLDGVDVRQRDMIALRRSLGYVIQSGGLFPHMTVAANIGLLGQLEGWQPARVRARVEELLALVDLPAAEFAARYPGELSGGQAQRVGVARALCLDPGHVLMDEPFGALDPITRAQVHEEFLELRRKVDKTIVMVTHDMAEAFKLADRVALLDGGRLVQVGTEEQFRSAPASPLVENFLRQHLGARA